MASIYKTIPQASGGGTGAVDSVNGQTGDVIITRSSIGLGNVNNTSDATKNAAVATLTNKTIVDPSGAIRKLAGYNNSSELYPIPALNIDTNSGALNQTALISPDNLGGGFGISSVNVNIDPLQDSPDDGYNVLNVQLNFDINSSGFDQGTSGQAANLLSLYADHQGTGDIGQVQMINNYVNLGNGTDPITVRGLFLSSGFADINSGVTITDQVQGYNFQPHFRTGSVLQNNIYGFADFAAVDVAAKGYTSYFANPQITSIANNNNYFGLNNNPTIGSFIGNAGYTGVGVFPNITNLGDQGNFRGIDISPNVTLNRGNAVGLSVNMANVTNYTGVKASLVAQDITYGAITAGAEGNSLQVQYLDTVTAGNEQATVVNGNTIQVAIQSGVSTATQVHAALVANSSITSNVTFPITGVGNNAQTAFGPTPLAGGVDPGRKKAAQFDGDVSINGALSFTGGLSIGSLNSFANKDLATLQPGVNSIDTLITAPTLVFRSHH